MIIGSVNYPDATLPASIISGHLPWFIFFAFMFVSTVLLFNLMFVVVYGDYSIFARQEATRNNFMQVI